MPIRSIILDLSILPRQNNPAEIAPGESRKANSTFRDSQGSILAGLFSCGKMDETGIIYCNYPVPGIIKMNVFRLAGNSPMN